MGVAIPVATIAIPKKRVTLTLTKSITEIAKNCNLKINKNKKSNKDIKTYSEFISLYNSFTSSILIS